MNAKRWKCVQCGHGEHVPWEAKTPEWQGRFVGCAKCGALHSANRAREFARFTGCDSDSHAG